MFDKNNPFNNRQSGFTFVEVMVAVLAIALLSAIAAPRLSLMADSARLSSTASKITSLMSAARANSASTGRTCETICYKEKNACESRCRDNGPGADEQPSRSETIKTCEWSYGSLDFDSKENSNEAAVTFFPDGSSSGGSMSLSDEHGETILIEVFRATALAYARKAEK